MSAARRAAVIGRWTARIAGTLMALFFLAFFVGEGFPNIFRLHLAGKSFGPGPERRRGGVASRLDMGGAGRRGRAGCHGSLYAPDWHAGNWRLLLVPAAIGLLHVVCWWRLRSAGVGWEVPRKILIVVGLAVGVFILLCANEVFGMPPLMTPALHPPPDMVGTWEANCPPWTRSSPSIPTHRSRAGLATLRSSMGASSTTGAGLENSCIVAPTT